MNITLPAMSPVLAVVAFVVLFCVDFLLGPITNCLKLHQPFDLNKLPGQFEAYGKPLLVQLLALLVQAFMAGGTPGATAVVVTLYGAAATGAASLLKDIVGKVVILFSGSEGSTPIPATAPAAPTA